MLYRTLAPMQVRKARLCPSGSPFASPELNAKPLTVPERRPSLAERVAEATLGAPGLLRAPIGRWAVRKGLLAHALAVAPRDGYVLARAGFFEPAGALARPDSPAWLAAQAGLGRLDRLAERREAFLRLEPGDRRWIAGLTAAWDAAEAFELMDPSMAVERAACLLALGRDADAEALLEPAVRSAERSLLLAASMAGRGAWKVARAYINAAFAARALDVPLREDVDTPVSLEGFKPASRAGSVEGPQVSLVMPVRDAAPTLAMAVRSLLAQTWRNLEVLVIDDGSSDGSARIARDLAAADPRVRALDNAGTPGPSGGRNTGMTAATGEFIGFHDADDWAHPQRIEQQVAAISEGGAVATVSRHFRLDAGGRPVSPRVTPMVRLAPISLLARAEAVRAAGPYEVSPVGADSEYLARLDLLFGRPRVARLDKIHIVAAWAETSISGARPTGLSTAEGRAAREAYERDWRTRHARRVKDGLP